MADAWRVLLVGYGYVGATIHAPLIQSVPGMALAAVVSRQPDKVQAEWPGVPVYPDMATAVARCDAPIVVVATTNDTHAALALQALSAGRHVVVDKPLALDMAQTEMLLQAARSQRRVLTVFQNRRWDADWLAVQRVLAEGRLGRVVRVEGRMERYRPQVRARWREGAGPGAGLWYDLAPHLLDQALLQWGWPQRLRVQRARLRPGAVADDWFVAVLDYGGLCVTLHACMCSARAAPRWVIHGTLGSYVAHEWDPQETQLRAGVRPGAAGWGWLACPGELWSSPDGLTAPSVPQPVPGCAGDYRMFYAQLRDALAGRGDVPVSEAQIRQTMRALAMWCQDDASK